MGDLLGPPPTPGTGEGWVARPLNAELQYWALFGLAGWVGIFWGECSGAMVPGPSVRLGTSRGPALIAD